MSFESDDRGHIRIGHRHLVALSAGRFAVPWPVTSLREMFRGDRQPPADMDHCPMAYCFHFSLIENQLIAVCDVMGDRTGRRKVVRSGGSRKT